MAQEKKIPTLEDEGAGSEPGSLESRLASLEGSESGGLPPPIPGDKASDELQSADGVLPPPPLPSVGPPPVPDAGSSKSSESASDSIRSLRRSSPGETDDDSDSQPTGSRRTARRRPAGPVREQMAANDDAPSIGGLIYALEQKPSSKPFKYAAIGTVIWLLVGLGFAWLTLSSELAAGITFAELIAKPQFFVTLAAILVPVAVIWFLSLLAWRAEELRLRSSTMTEVAIRLAEPDRMAEQSVASLGQAVRRQVSFMNDAVSRALGRAGELEALVHNEVAALERSYEENERKIRGLIGELSGERFALLDTSGKVEETLRSLGTEIPTLIDKLSGQQVKLAQIIQGAGENLNSLESSIGSRSEQLQVVLEQYTGGLDNALDNRTQELQGMLATHTEALGSALGGQAEQMQDMLETYTGALATALGSRTEQMQSAFDEYLESLDTSIASRTDTLQTVFEEYGRALDSTLANRAEALDAQLVERTRALDDAFSRRLEHFDDAILRTTSAIDNAVGERAQALTNALDSHARTFNDTITQQATDLDESLVHGINAVRRSSENITRQSLKAIEGLASQSEMLKNVSENLLTQINSVTNRFESQGQTILQAANSLESANYKIDATLRNRHAELSETLGLLAGKAEEFGSFVEGYSSSIAGTITDAEQRARSVAEELKLGTQAQQQAALQDLNSFRTQADQESQRALADLRKRFSTVSDEVTSQLGSLTSRVDETTQEVRDRTRLASEQIAEEQARLRSQLDSLPAASQESTEAMRRSLQDQLKALEQLSNITSREGRSRDIAQPAGGSGNDGSRTSQPQVPSGRPMPEPGLSSLSSSLAKELAHRPAPGAGSPGPAGGNRNGGAPLPAGRGLPRPSATANPVQQSASRPQQAPGQAPPPQQAGAPRPNGQAGRGNGDNWSLGDLLKRASLDEDGHHGGGDDGAAARAASAQSVLPSTTNHPLDIHAMSRALDAGSAAGVWSRLRSGQRDIMVRSLYTPEGQAVFDELSRRHAVDRELQQTVTQYLADFERTLKDAEQQDASGQLVSQHLVSDMGRVYLFLAHASGRLG